MSSPPCPWCNNPNPTPLLLCTSCEGLAISMKSNRGLPIRDPQGDK